MGAESVPRTALLTLTVPSDSIGISNLIAQSTARSVQLLGNSSDSQQGYQLLEGSLLLLNSGTELPGGGGVAGAKQLRKDLTAGFVQAFNQQSSLPGFTPEQEVVTRQAQVVQLLTEVSDELDDEELSSLVSTAQALISSSLGSTLSTSTAQSFVAGLANIGTAATGSSQVWCPNSPFESRVCLTLPVF
jgi:hypothetical protein